MSSLSSIQGAEPDQYSTDGPRVVWDSPAFADKERVEVEELLTRVLRDALREMLEYGPFSSTGARRCGR